LATYVRKHLMWKASEVPDANSTWTWDNIRYRWDNLAKRKELIGQIQPQMVQFYKRHRSPYHKVKKPVIHPDDDEDWAVLPKPVILSEK
jgi:hypothetical protein